RPDARQHRDREQRLQDAPLRQHPQRTRAGVRPARRGRDAPGRRAPGAHRRGRHRVHRRRARAHRRGPGARLPLDGGPAPELRAGPGGRDAGRAQAGAARGAEAMSRGPALAAALSALALAGIAGGATAQAREAGAAAPATLAAQALGAKVRLRGMSAVDARVAWASGREGTVLRTVVGVATWQAMRVPGAEALDFRDVEGFDAEHAVVLSIGPGADSRVYRTGDGGRSWQLVLRNEDPRAFLDCMAFD